MEQEIRRLIATALEEDRASSDATSQACIRPEERCQAHFRLKQDACVAGLLFMPWVFHSLDPTLKFKALAQEGGVYKKGTLLAEIEGSALSLLAAERSALNMLQHLSGIATTVTAYVEAVNTFGCDILDTRKTLPGLRNLQKYAVRIGGGKNHRLHLADQILIKNNHLALLKKEGCPFPVKEAIQRARLGAPILIEVEVESLEMLEEALEAGADRILLDNMDLPMMQQAVQLCKGKAYLEASGGMSLSKVRAVAACGVNGISVGALTHSVCAVDINLSLT
jgi:nicotinate-nucleotide pyrophosphorylase (carboxylating)